MWPFDWGTPDPPDDDITRRYQAAEKDYQSTVELALGMSWLDYIVLPVGAYDAYQKAQAAAPFKATYEQISERWVSAVRDSDDSARTNEAENLERLALGAKRELLTKDGTPKADVQEQAKEAAGEAVDAAKAKAQELVDAAADAGKKGAKAAFGGFVILLAVVVGVYVLANNATK